MDTDPTIYFSHMDQFIFKYGHKPLSPYRINYICSIHI